MEKKRAQGIQVGCFFVFFFWTAPAQDPQRSSAAVLEAAAQAIESQAGRRSIWVLKGHQEEMVAIGWGPFMFGRTHTSILTHMQSGCVEMYDVKSNSVCGFQI